VVQDRNDDDNDDDDDDEKIQHTHYQCCHQVITGVSRSFATVEIACVT